MRPRSTWSTRCPTRSPIKAISVSRRRPAEPRITTADGPHLSLCPGIPDSPAITKVPAPSSRHRRGESYAVRAAALLLLVFRQSLRPLCRNLITSSTPAGLCAAQTQTSAPPTSRRFNRDRLTDESDKSAQITDSRSRLTVRRILAPNQQTVR
jgi:hypothetical protein